MRPPEEYQLAIRCLSGLSLFLGVASIICGVLTLSFAMANLVWPLNSGAPIWTGIIVVIAGSLGSALSAMENPSHRNATFICQVDSFLVFTILSLVVCALDLAHALAILGECAAKINTVATWCISNYEENLIMAAINFTLAVVMAIISICSLILYSLLRKDLSQPRHEWGS